MVFVFCFVLFFIVNVANPVLGDLVASSPEVYSLSTTAEGFLHRLVKES